VTNINPAKEITNKAIALIMLSLGPVSLLGSAFYSSYVAAFTGLGLTFWGALLMYLTSSKHVRLELLTATASSALSDIERILANTELDMKAVYLPPKHLKDYESSLVFIPSKPNGALPKPEETSEINLYSENAKGLFITPPGLALSKLFERKLGKSFSTVDLAEMQRALPKLFDELEITKNLSFQVEGNLVSIETGDHIFKDLCAETRKLQKTHETVGCPLSSAIACSLAKASGKPVIVEKELLNLDGTTRTTYRLLEE